MARRQHDRIYKPAARPTVLSKPADVPEDVRSELDAEERRALARDMPAARAEPIPEDVLAEHDVETRVGREEIRQRLSEGRPPVEEEPRS